MRDCKGKAVLITGASAGIGQATAKMFAQGGARLILAARRVERLEELADELKKECSSEILTVQLDVSDRQAVEEKIGNLPAEWQEVDILVNNAGLAAGRDKLQEANLDDFDAMIDVNLKGLLYVSKMIVPGMVERNSGHVINLGSTAGLEPYAGGGVYCGTKYFVRCLSQALKMDLLGTDVRVSSVDPGLVETEFSKVRFKGDEGKADAVYEGIRPLTPDDIADAIYYCATRPLHVNVSQMVLLTTDQASGTQIHRKQTG